ncbi:MAG: hypothetical protein KatS3mg011_0978 [Acidimicrobiia bacterium]|nr:MAG: hypothetical protein KatS3mg011_0978 [Acidimicrobiia bacterium]
MSGSPRRRGRHAAPRGDFARELAVMVAGILAVGLVVFGGLWVMADLGDDTPTQAEPTRTTATAATLGITQPPPTSTSTTTTTTGPTTTTTVPRPPGEVTVQVLNGKGVAGLAGRVTEELAGDGYRTLPADNHSPLDTSRIWYKPGFQAEAELLAASFPDAVVEPVPADLVSEADIVVVLGASYEE